MLCREEDQEDLVRLLNIVFEGFMKENEEIITDGKGKSYGLEFLYQQKLKNNFYGILSYTYFFSKFSGSDNVYLPSVWDNRHILSFTGGYKLNKNWEVSAKIRFTGKTPYPPTNLKLTTESYPEIVFESLGDLMT